MEEPLKDILDRDLYCKLVEEYFGETLQLLRELANYGSNLIPRCFVSSNGEITDIVLLISMLKQAVSLVDSIEVLASRAAPTHGFILLRSLWEMNVYMEWTLVQDTPSRATMYFVHDVRSQLRWALSVKDETSEAREHKAQMHDAPEGAAERVFDQAKVDESIRILRAKLEAPECQTVNGLFEHLPTGRKPASWFTPAGCRSIRHMAAQVHKSAEYHILYSGYCKSTHGQIFHEQVGFRDDKIIYEPIRNLRRLHELLSSTVTYIIRMYRLVILHYRQEEIAAFNKKYATEWMMRIRAMSTVEYDQGTYKIHYLKQ